MATCYDPARKPCAKGPTPGAKALMAVILRRFPRTTNGGIFNCRNVRGKSTPSKHGNGEAGDNMCAVAVGRVLRSQLCAIAPELGIQFVIHDRKKYGCEWGFTARPYGGESPHTDHVHWELTIAAARNLTEQRITEVWERHFPQAEPDPTNGRWDEMATKEEIKQALREVLDDRRISGGADADPDHYRDADADDITYETRSGVRKILRHLGIPF